MRHHDGSSRSATALRVAASILAAAVLLFSRPELALATLVYVQETPYPDLYAQGFGRAIDETRNLIYIAGASKVRVFDGETNAELANVPLPAQTLGLAVNPSTHLLYAASFAAAQIYVIDTVSNSLSSTITLDRRPIGIAVNPISNRVYATTRDSLQVIDGTSHAVLKVIELGLETFQVALNSHTNRIYVSNRTNLSISVIAGETDTVIGTVQINDPSTCSSCSLQGLAVNAVTNRVYVGAHSPLVGFRGIGVVDGATFAVIARIPTDLMLDIAVSETTQRIYLASFYTGLTVISGSTNSVISVGLVSSSLIVAVNARTNKVYVGAFNFTVLAERALVTTPTLSPNPSRSSFGVQISSRLQEDVPAAVAAEYFIGNDPGQGNGESMLIDGQSLSGVVGFKLVAGTYPVGVRARDSAGIWGPVGWTTLVIDTSMPTLGPLSFSVNPKAIGESTIITVDVTDDASGIGQAEYFVGDDPGVGNGAVAVSTSGSTISAVIGSGYATGIYSVGMRARDRAGNWSATAAGYLVVYDPGAGFATGAGSIVPGGPSSDPGDLLPGLDASSRARFAFVVKYNKGSSTVPSGDLEFQYSVSSQSDCMTPGACGGFKLRSAAMDWLIVTNPNSAKFQGMATIDGMTGLFPFRVDARDGDRIAQPDRFTITIYAAGADPNESQPIYRASGDVQGQVQIRQ